MLQALRAHRARALVKHGEWTHRYPGISSGWFCVDDFCSFLMCTREPIPCRREAGTAFASDGASERLSESLACQARRKRYDGADVLAMHCVNPELVSFYWHCHDSLGTVFVLEQLLGLRGMWVHGQVLLTG